MWRHLLFACVLLAACGGGSRPHDIDSGSEHLDAAIDSGGGASDAGADVDAGAVDDAGPGPNDAGPIAIDSGTSDAGHADRDAGAFPGCGFVDALDDGCRNDGECAFGVHQTDCCGNSAAIGFRASERALFDEWEPLCDATYPACGCPTGPTRTDSGEVVFDEGAIHVACVSRGPRSVCLTYVTMRPLDSP